MTELIIWFVACAFSTFGILYFYCHLLECNFTLKKSLIVVYIFGVIIQALIKYFDFTLLSILSYFFFYPVFFYLINRLSFRKIFYYSIVIWMLGLIFDFINMFFVSFIINYGYFNDQEYLLKLVPTIIMCIFFCIIAHFKILRNLIHKLYFIVIKIKYINFFLVIFSIFILIICIFLSFNIREINLTYVTGTILFLSICIFLMLLKFKYEEIENKIFIETLKNNNNFYIKMDTEQKILKHNLIAKLSSIKSVANKKSQKLIDELIGEFNSNIDYSAKIRSIPYGLNGIISFKLNDYADFLNIKVFNNINVDIFEILSPKKYNVLVEKLSLSIDNALESCINSFEKTLIINLFLSENTLRIEIKNTFSGQLDVENLGQLNYSTKGRKRGFGLYSILRNNEVSVKIKIINNFFVCELLVKIN